MKPVSTGTFGRLVDLDGVGVAADVVVALDQRDVVALRQQPG
jgi:hypothetical protein